MHVQMIQKAMIQKVKNIHGQYKTVKAYVNTLRVERDLRAAGQLLLLKCLYGKSKAFRI